MLLLCLDCAVLPQSPSNGKVTGSQYLQDDVVTYSCDEGYVLEGKDKSTCQNDRSWTNVNSTTCRAGTFNLTETQTLLKAKPVTHDIDI